MSPTSLLQLPSDVHHLIWHHLRPTDLLAVAQTCRTFSADLANPQVTFCGCIVLEAPHVCDATVPQAHAACWVHCDGHAPSSGLQY